MGPVNFDFYGRRCRIYDVGTIVDKPEINDIVKDENGNYFVYSYNTWNKLMASNENQVLLNNILLSNHEPIELAMKTTKEEQDKKYSVFENLLKI